jgi:hypothetical protein
VQLSGCFVAEPRGFGFVALASFELSFSSAVLHPGLQQLLPSCFSLWPSARVTGTLTQCCAPGVLHTVLAMLLPGWAQPRPPCLSLLLLLLLCCTCRYKQEHVAPEAQGVTPVPETTQVQVDTLAGAPAGAPEADQMGMADFLVLACDGLWDCMSNQQVCGLVCGWVGCCQLAVLAQVHRYLGSLAAAWWKPRVLQTLSHASHFKSHT